MISFKRVFTSSAFIRSALAITVAATGIVVTNNYATTECPEWISDYLEPIQDIVNKCENMVKYAGYVTTGLVVLYVDKASEIVESAIKLIQNHMQPDRPQGSSDLEMVAVQEQRTPHSDQGATAPEASLQQARLSVI